LKKDTKAVDFKQPTAGELLRWCDAEAKSQGAEFGRGAAGHLIELAGEDQWRLSNEIAKLAAYHTPISIGDVESMVEASLETDIFQLLDALARHDRSAAMRFYSAMREGGADDRKILPMVIWQLRGILYATSAGHISAAELAEQADIKPYAAQKALTHSRRWSYPAARTAFLTAVDTDFKIKSGLGKADALLEHFILKLVAASPAERR
jgi:DNA polymerase III delta subunit